MHIKDGIFRGGILDEQNIEQYVINNFREFRNFIDESDELV